MDCLQERSLDQVANCLEFSSKQLHVIGVIDQTEMKYFMEQVDEIVVYESRPLKQDYLKTCQKVIISNSVQRIYVEDLNFEFQTPIFDDSFSCLYFSNTGMNTFCLDLWTLRLIEANINCLIVSIANPLSNKELDPKIERVIPGTLKSGDKINIYRYILNERYELLVSNVFHLIIALINISRTKLLRI